MLIHHRAWRPRQCQRVRERVGVHVGVHVGVNVGERCVSVCGCVCMCERVSSPSYLPICLIPSSLLFPFPLPPSPLRPSSLLSTLLLSPSPPLLLSSSSSQVVRVLPRHVSRHRFNGSSKADTLTPPRDTTTRTAYNREPHILPRHQRNHGRVQERDRSDGRGKPTP